ncbi:aminoglycoside phosphotransferase family protein [Aquiflexum sp. LQ15W]|uniref:phosphotransferase enzyme family protein n=1 Tax=Cognataquiflexum nitidum TaxID=2922272 RepID=UPI001F130DDD|nr:aminoglycoside phosphotransferase family protein [Cognataquiflexum nitidum]MCH6200508.1 aminoglycoside phosphotransferase family protein [Cognataquiflexum nitidum]
MSPFSWLPALNTQYGLEIHPSLIRPFGDGHIHQTFLIESGEEKLILQRFNNLVFKYPERISHNQSLLIEQIDSEDLPYILPLPIPNLAGELFTLIEGTYFRISPFVAGRCVNEIENPHQAYLAAKAFAQFIKAGIHIPAKEFQEAIPGFHDLELRYNQLLEALKNTKRDIVGDLKELVEFYLAQKDLVDQYLRWKEKLPLRLTHSDTKINNLIFAEDFSKVNAVIDLDTLMAGYVYYDFGDLVRTVACTEGESSKDWEKIRVDFTKYEALLVGFLEVGKGAFTEDEIYSLPFGGLMMTCIMGFRFLADYLNGNIYYTIHYEEQNLHRAKNQMCLLKGLREKLN